MIQQKKSIYCNGCGRLRCMCRWRGASRDCGNSIGDVRCETSQVPVAMSDVEHRSPLTQMKPSRSTAGHVSLATRQQPMFRGRCECICIDLTRKHSRSRESRETECESEIGRPLFSLLCRLCEQFLLIALAFSRRKLRSANPFDSISENSACR